jgi:hypothetical protein
MADNAFLSRTLRGDPLRRADALVANPAFAYVAIAALQLRLIWNVWKYKDLTFGDTSSYFTQATWWTHGLHDDILWSPLYTDVWGTLLAIFGNVYTALMVHRVAIVLCAALLVLALARRLLGPSLGLLVAVWWTILPPNFNVEYEVHLFSFLPLVFAVLLLARSQNSYARGAVLGLLLVETALLRNEQIISTVLLIAAIFVAERRERGATPQQLRTYLRAYGLPVLIAALLIGGAYWRSEIQGSQVVAGFNQKQELSLCQAYVFNYEQRHPSYTANAFTDCIPLMQQTFGSTHPTILSATVANPRAMAAFMGWNTVLFGSGLQVSLFGATGTGDDPDYFPVQEHQDYTWLLSLLVLAALAAGGLAIRANPEFWRREWLPPRLWAIGLLAALGLTAIFVGIVEQRPRAEYIYELTVGIMLLTAVSVSALLTKWKLTRFSGVVAALTVAVLIVVVPGYYSPAPRPIKDAVAHLIRYQARLAQPDSILLTSNFSSEICNYLAHGFSRVCTPASEAVVAALGANQPAGPALKAAGVNVVYADPGLMAIPEVKTLVADPAPAGFARVAQGQDEDGPWALLFRIHKP